MRSKISLSLSTFTLASPLFALNVNIFYVYIFFRHEMRTASIFVTVYTMGNEWTKRKQSSAKKKYLMSMSNEFHREHIFKSNGIRWSEKKATEEKRKRSKKSATKREMSEYAESAKSHRTSIHLKSRLSSLRKWELVVMAWWWVRVCVRVNASVRLSDRKRTCWRTSRKTTRIHFHTQE